MIRLGLIAMALGVSLSAAGQLPSPTPEVAARRSRDMKQSASDPARPDSPAAAWGTLMNTQHYKKRLLAIEKSLSARIGREGKVEREQPIDSQGDAGDASVADVATSDRFTEDELDSMILQQVRDALRRIDDGTFGKCVVDGGPIGAKRLEAVPWTPYCLKHQNLIEASSQPRTFTL